MTAEAGLLSGSSGLSLVTAGERMDTERGGDVQLSIDGSFAYQPPSPVAWGTDRFSYGATDGLVESGATVRLTLQPVALSLGEIEPGGNGFVVHADPEVPLGPAVASAGDVNGDGLMDLVVGAPSASPLGVSSAGAVYVVFGKVPGSFVSASDIQANMGRGFAILGELLNDALGTSVAGAGDVNGDGLDDVIIGAPAEDQERVGAAYVVFGRSDGVTVSLSGLGSGGNLGFAIQGADPDDRAGTLVAGAGDLNGDGFADVLVGARPGGVGLSRVYAVYGSATPATVLLTELRAAQGFMLEGSPEEEEAEEVYDTALVSAGDVNGDGLDDFALASGSTAYIVFGARTAPAVRSVSTLGALEGVTISGPGPDGLSGAVLAGAGDVNGDGLADVIVGTGQAPESSSVDHRAFFIVFGKANADPVALDALSEGNGFSVGIAQLYGDCGDYGLSASGVGDVNGDGFDDLALAGWTEASCPNASPSAYLLLGGPAPVSLPLADVPGERGLALIASGPNDLDGATVAGAGDVNGDGLDDLALVNGSAYVLFGWDATDTLGERDRALIGGGDALVYDGTPLISSVGGRRGTTLRFAGEQLTLDLRNVCSLRTECEEPSAREPGRFRKIDIIDLGTSGNNTLVLDDWAIRRLPGRQLQAPGGFARTLVVIGTLGDVVRFSDASYERRGSNAGREVYAKSGAFYGLEISPGILQAER